MICIIIGAFPPEIGGAELHVAEVAKRLVEKGFDVVVLTRYPRNMKGLPKRETIDGFDIIRISTPNLFLIRFLGFLIQALIEVFKIRKRVKVIYAHHVLSIGFLAVIIGKLFRKPVVIRDGLQPGVFRNLLTKPGIGWSMRYTIRMAEVIIVGTEALFGIIKSLRIKPSAELIVFPNPVDNEVFKPYPHAKEELGLDDSFVLLYVGRLIKLKGVDYIIKAVPTLRKEIPNLKVMIIGNGTEMSSLIELSKELEVEGIVSFTGRKDIKALPLYYSAADIYIQLSIDEGFSNTIPQAMACEVPVICARTGGLIELVSDEKTGFLIYSRNSEEVAKAVLRVYNDRDLGKRTGQNARHYVMKKLTWDDCMGNLIDVFDSVINNRRKNV